MCFPESASEYCLNRQMDLSTFGLFRICLDIYDVLSVYMYVTRQLIFSSNVHNTKAQLCRMSTALILTRKGIQKNLKFSQTETALLLLVDLEDIYEYIANVKESFQIESTTCLMFNV